MVAIRPALIHGVTHNESFVWTFGLDIMATGRFMDVVRCVSA